MVTEDLSRSSIKQCLLCCVAFSCFCEERKVLAGMFVLLILSLFLGGVHLQSFSFPSFNGSEPIYLSNPGVASIEGGKTLVLINGPEWEVLLDFLWYVMIFVG